MGIPSPWARLATLIRNCSLEANCWAGRVAGMAWLVGGGCLDFEPAFLQQTTWISNMDCRSLSRWGEPAHWRSVGIAPGFRASVRTCPVLNGGHIQGGGTQLRSLLWSADGFSAVASPGGTLHPQHAARAALDLGFETRDLAVVSFDWARSNEPGGADASFMHRSWKSERRPGCRGHGHV